jgi:hypothetical protein
MQPPRNAHRLWFNNYSKYSTYINKSLKNNNTNFKTINPKLESKNKEKKFIWNLFFL